MKPLVMMLVDIQTNQFFHDIETIVGMEVRSIFMNVHFVFMNEKWMITKGNRLGFS